MCSPGGNTSGRQIPRSRVAGLWKRKSLPGTAASSLPLFSKARGPPERAPRGAARITPSLWFLSGCELYLGASCHRWPWLPQLVPGAGRRMTTFIWGPGSGDWQVWAKIISQKPGQEAGHLKLHPDYHLGQTSRLWGNWQILGWRKSGGEEEVKDLGLNGHKDNDHNNNNNNGNSNWYLLSDWFTESCILYSLSHHLPTATLGGGIIIIPISQIKKLRLSGSSQPTSGGSQIQIWQQSPAALW